MFNDPELFDAVCNLVVVIGLVYRARESEDLTRDKPDPKDAVLIARLANKLRCYEPERADAVWARLRHMGARRLQLSTDACRVSRRATY